MVITAEDAGAVIYCRGSELAVVEAEAWNQSGAEAQALLKLSAGQALALARFLRYWLEDHGDGPIYREAGTVFDF